MKSIKAFFKKIEVRNRKQDKDYKPEDRNYGEIIHNIIFARADLYKETNGNIIYYINFNTNKSDSLKDYFEFKNKLSRLTVIDKIVDDNLYMLMSIHYNDILGEIYRFRYDQDDNKFMRFLISDLRSNIPIESDNNRINNDLYDVASYTNKIFTNIKKPTDISILNIIYFDNILSIMNHNNYGYNVLSIFSIEELLHVMDICIQCNDKYNDDIFKNINIYDYTDNINIYVINLFDLVEATNNRNSDTLNEIKNIMSKDKIYFGMLKDNVYINILDECKHIYTSKYIINNESTNSYNPYDEVDEIIE